MSYFSKYQGKKIDEAVFQATDKLPIRMSEVEKSISSLSKNKAEVGAVPKKISQLEDDVELSKTKQTVKDLGKDLDELAERVENMPAGGGGGDGGYSGAKLVSVHDDLTSIIPDDGEMYIVKYDNMPYGEDPNLISDAVFYRIKIGDGVTNLANLPVISNIQSGAGNGSLILVDPTYDNGDDGLEAPNNTADAQYAVSLGKYLKNSAKATVITGYSNTATEKAIRSFIGGSHNELDAPQSIIGGNQNKVFSDGISGSGLAIVLGTGHEYHGYASLMAGEECYLGSAASHTHLFGRGLKSNVPDQTVLGTYNVEDINALLIFGCGYSDSSRENAFIVRNNGKVEFAKDITISGKSFNPNDALVAKEFVQTLNNATKDSLVPYNLSVNIDGSYLFKPVDGYLKENDFNFKLNGYLGDTTVADGLSYTEYPPEGSNSTRQWATLGSTGNTSNSAGLYMHLFTDYMLMPLYTGNWVAFKVKIPEAGMYSVVADYWAMPKGSIVETYLMPLTEEVETEFAPDNEDTYGVCTSSGNGAITVREGAKKFDELTSVDGVESIGTLNTVGTKAKVAGKKIGAKELFKGEYVLLFREIGASNDCRNFALSNITLTKFEEYTDAIKVGETTLTESTLSDMLGHREELDDINGHLDTVESIAKGRATGYVFDTVADLDIWLEDETNVAQLVLGDNFYVRDIGVPDYWWDGQAKQPLETQKVDLTEYVKNTGYATRDKTGVVSVNSSWGINAGSSGGLFIVEASTGQIKNRSSAYCPITPNNLEYAVKSVGDGYYATEEQVGDISTALDSILAMQSSYIGGETE